jgi:hypothetical protein
MRLLLATTAMLALFTAGAVQAQTGSTDVELRQAIARGAMPITLVMRGEHGGLQRHAAYRLPATHGDQHLIDQMAGHGVLTQQQHQNASN